MKHVLGIVAFLLFALPAGAAISFVASSTTPSPSSGAVSSLTINRPAAVVSSDLMIVQIGVRGSSNPSFTVPSGWSLVTRQQGSQLTQAIYYRRAGSSEPSTYTWSFSPSNRAAIAMLVYHGVDPTNPIEANQTQTTTSSSTSITAPTLSAHGSQREIVRLFSIANGGATITVPGALTQRYSTTATGSGTSGVAMIAGSSPQSASGATGTSIATSSIGAENIGMTLELKPDPAVLTPTLIAEYRFDEASWNGSAGEVTDSSGTYEARARNSASTAGTSPAISGSPGTCRYGSFNGTNQYVELPSTLPKPGEQFTISAWIRTTHDWSTQKDQRVWVADENDQGFGLSLGDPGARQLRFFARSPSLTTLDSAAVIETGQWYFVAAVMDASVSETMALYVYSSAGVLLDRQTTTRTSFTPETGKVAIGGEVDGSGEGVERWRFRGNIDEVRFHSGALTASGIAALLATTRPCGAGATSFKFTHSSTGLFCVDHTVTLTTLDASGNATTGYTGTVNLTTSSGNGTWLLSSGAGTLTDAVADDGAASYAWNATQSSSTFLLRYRTGSAVVTLNAVDSTSPSIADDNSHGSITFSPSGFTVTSSALSNPPPVSIPAFASPQVAGTAFNVHLTAYGQTPTDPTCGVIEGYTGAKSLKFWSTYADPATGTRTVAIDGTAIATSEASSAARAVTFTNGQAVVSARYADAGSLAIAMKDDTTGNPDLPNGIRGSTGNIVSRPADFIVSNIKRTADSVANPAASTASGSVFLAAGRAFTATVTAVDSSGNTTPNFGRESSPETVKFSVSLVLPASGNTPAVTGTAGTFANGVATGTAFAWPEVGIVKLVPRVSDGNYLGAGDVVGSMTGNVGRFIPDSFGVVLNTPVFGTGCAAGSYTYIGQPVTYTVAPVITVTARAFGGATTQNYTGSLFRLTNASLTGRAYAAATGTLDTSGLPATSVDPVIAEVGSGVATLTFSAGTGLSFTRSTPVAPFTASISLSQNVIDLDSVSAGNPVIFGSGSGIAFSTGASQRYGRLSLRNAVGSELLDLPMSLATQYYVSSTVGFAANAGDSCTTAPPIAFSGFQGALATGEVCIRDTGSPGVSTAGCATPAPLGSRYRSTASAGSFNLVLSAPGSGNNGAAIVTATAPSWLQFDWNTTAPGNENPTALASFGLFPGPSSRIYLREVF